MKMVSILFLLFLFACNNQSTSTDRSTKGYSKEQLHLSELKDQYTSSYENAPNDIVKREIKDSFIKKVNRYLADTLKFYMPNFKVTVDDITVQALTNTKAFYARFYDDDNYPYASVTNNEYWMEFDYQADSAGKLQQNPAYELLRAMPKNADTVLSFFYMGEVEWNGVMSDQLKIRVVPFPKNYNFDSARAANKASIKRN